MNKLLEAQAYNTIYELNKAFFNLRMPVICRVTKSKKFCKSFSAMWELADTIDFDLKEVEYHKISFSICCCMDKDHFRETVIHELCHAQQWEQGISDTPHNKAFFSRLDYVLAQVGLPATSLEYRQAIKKY